MDGGGVPNKRGGPATPGGGTLPACCGPPAASGQITLRETQENPHLNAGHVVAPLDAALRSRLERLLDEGHEQWRRFDDEVRSAAWHPFVPADYDKVLATLLGIRGEGRTFLEWGSGNGVITIMADLLGWEAYGIELDPDLVDTARLLAGRFESGARFAHGSFLPTGYTYRDPTGDHRTGTIGAGPSGYLELGLPLESFDLVYGYPWSGEDAVMIDVMKKYGGENTRFLMHGSTGIEIRPTGRRGK